MKKRIFAVTILFITIINIYNLSFAETASSADSLSTQVVDNDTINTVEKPGFDINSEEAVLIDAKTGNVLAQKNMDKQAYPASTTKILTAIIAIEKLNLNDIITASNSAVMAIPVGYSNAGIKAGDLVKKAAEVTNGKGGGRPDIDQAGGKDLDKVTEAINLVKEIIKNA